MHHQTGGLIDHHHGVVLKQHVEGDMLRQERDLIVAGNQGHGDFFATKQLGFRWHGLAIDTDKSIFGQPGQPTARILRQHLGQNLV